MYQNDLESDMATMKKLAITEVAKNLLILISGTDVDKKTTKM
jgi:hypothetical protein